MKRRKKIRRKRKILDKKLVFSTGIIVVIVLGLIYYKVFVQTPEIKFSLKAAIIDQLGKHFPNFEFNDTVNGEVPKLLKRAGFDVFYHASESINVTFYKGLAKYNYGLIILRAHSALRVDNETKEILGVDLFTSENYTKERADELWRERTLGLVSKGEYLWEPGKFYFAITPLFIESLEGYFPKSIVIAMGCWSLNLTQMANAFIKKGAIAYIGWTDTVYPQDTDNETVNFLKMLLNEDDPLGYAVSKTSNYTYPSGTQTITTHLDFYPKSAYNLTMSELIKKAKASTTLQSTVDSFKPLQPLIGVANVIKCKSKDFTI